MTPMSTNYLDFGSVVGGFFSVRSFRVQNVSMAALVLGIASSSPCVAVYAKHKPPQIDAPKAASPALEQPRKPDRKSGHTSTGSGAGGVLFGRGSSHEQALGPRQSPTPAYLDLALPRKRSHHNPVCPPNDHLLSSVEEIAEFIARMNAADVVSPQKPWTFSSANLPASVPVAIAPSSSSAQHLRATADATQLVSAGETEHRYVKTAHAVRKSLEAIIRNGELVPITDAVTIDAQAELEVYAVLSAPETIDRHKKFDTRLVFSLVSYDHSLLQAQPAAAAELPVRDFLARSIICPCIMDVGQRSINLGTLDLHVAVKKLIDIRNRSDHPLLYAIKKTGSIASGDIAIESRLGIVPPHGKRDVSFVFRPMLPGAYLERIAIENILNPANSQALVLKANVKRNETFSVKSGAIDFGTCSPSSPGVACVELYSSAKAARAFTIRAAPSGNDEDAVAFEFSVQSSEAVEPNSKETEEQLESLEQKLKIATRKGATEKAEKITQTISKLRRSLQTAAGATAVGTAPILAAAAGSGLGEVGDKLTSGTSLSVLSRSDDHSSAALESKRNTCFTFSVEASSLTRVVVAVSPRRNSASHTTVRQFSGLILIHPQRNTDVRLSVPYAGEYRFDATAPPVASPSPQPSASPSASQSVFSPKQVAPVAEAVTVGTKSIELDKVAVNAETTFSFLATNASDSAVRVAVEASSCGDDSTAPAATLKYSTHVLAPNGATTVTVHFTPTRSGRQSFAVAVAGKFGVCELKVRYTGVFRDGLAFFVAGREVTELNLGYCYNARRRHPRALLEVRSTLPERVRLAVQSTLAQQVVLCPEDTARDGACIPAFTEGHIDAGGLLRLVVYVNPNLAAAATAAPSAMASSGNSGRPRNQQMHEARDMVGGLKFQCYSIGAAQNTDEMLYSRQLRFEGLIGHSLLGLSASQIDLGATSEIAPVFASLTVHNLSDRMPLAYVAVSSDPGLVAIATTHGHDPEFGAECSGVLCGANDDGIADAQQTIAIRINATSPGYHHAQIRLTNANVPDNICTVPVWLFAEQNSLKMPTLTPGIAVSSGEGKNHSLAELPSATWPIMYKFFSGEGSNKALQSVEEVARKTPILNPGVECEVFALLRSEYPDFCDGGKPVPANASRIRIPSNSLVDYDLLPPQPSIARDSDEMRRLERGKQVSSKEALLFIDCATRRVLGAVNLVANYCISRGEVTSKSISTRARRGECVSLTITVKNHSEAPLVLSAKYPAPLQVDSRIVVPDSATCDILVKLDTRDIPSCSINSGSMHEWNVTLANLNNPGNVLSVPVAVKIIEPSLTVEDGDISNDGALVMPCFRIPQFAPACLDSWFVLRNRESCEMRCTLSLEYARCISDLIQLSVLSRYSNSPISWVTLPPEGTVEIKVRATILTASRLVSSDHPQALLNDAGAQLGTIHVESTTGRLSLAVCGTIIEEASFSLETSSFEIFSACATDIAITNCSPVHKLNLSIEPETIQDDGSDDTRCLDVPPNVTIQPSSVYKLPVKLTGSERLEAGDVVYIHFKDTDSISRARKTVSLRYIDAPAPSPHSLAAERASRAAERDDVALIKGCTRREHTYDLDLGQQDLGTPCPPRKISFELSRAVACRFKLQVIPPSASRWLLLSKAEGALDPAASKSQSVAVTASVNTRCSLQAYIVFENVDNPCYTKYIKCSVEVVAPFSCALYQGAGGSSSIDDAGVTAPPECGNSVNGAIKCTGRAYDVYCNGIDQQQQSITYGRIPYGRECNLRSFTIANNEAVPLEFSFKTLRLSRDDATSVRFSVSPTSKHYITGITIAAETSTKIFVRLRPEPSSCSGNGEIKNFDILVNCRLVRDHQQTIAVSASCFPSSYDIDTAELMFVAPLAVTQHCATRDADKKRELEAEIRSMAPAQHDVTLRNTSADSFTRLLLLAPTSGLFCSTLADAQDVLLAPLESRIVSITVDHDGLLRKCEDFYRDRTLTDRLVVYNSAQPVERTVVALKLCVTAMEASNVAGCHIVRSATQHGHLEARILSFLREYTWSMAPKGDCTAMERQDELSAHVCSALSGVLLNELVWLATEFPSDLSVTLAWLFFTPLHRMMGGSSNDGARRNQLAHQVAPEHRDTLVFWARLLQTYIAYFHAPSQTNSPLDGLRRLHAVVMAQAEQSM